MLSTGLEPLTMAVVMEARERMCEVLTPHLGASLALERANNIAQVLLLDDHQPLGVAYGMLREVLPPGRRVAVARDLCRAWSQAAARRELQVCCA